MNDHVQKWLFINGCYYTYEELQKWQRKKQLMNNTRCHNKL